jgi:ATP-dependent Clp protease ATP-binding subunit ClpB
MTSNIGSDVILDADTPEKTADAKVKVSAMLKSTFRPEFLNRIDEIVMFSRLDRSCISGIVKISSSVLRSVLMTAA